ncbi:hypothetical protein [Streptomyces cellostaticus]|uniref:hypothetical protein n=1 Tax=Streptomyces cellostaticus TaxID=67285 RepID=UPI0020264861|nr:hypothetical protein [Streptomyces cellostaticus]
MFDIRVICDPADTDHIVTALSGAFNAGPVNVYPARDGSRTRLYLRAEHKRTPERSVMDWPNASQAYATAPHAGRELDWLDAAEERGREWWLRRAALADRMAAGLVPGRTASTGDAFDLACHLMALDGTDEGCNPRAYVRQQYARWVNNR